MAIIIDTNNTTLNLIAKVDGADTDTHTVRGYSTASPGMVLDNQDVFTNISRSLDGSAIAYRSEQNEGVLTVNLIAISPSVKWFQDRYSELRSGSQVVISGSIISGVTGAVVNLTGGLLSQVKQFPDLTATGNADVPFVITFDDARGDYSGFDETIFDGN